jgi:hypothetical protein
MSLSLTCNITIGNYRFSGVNEVTVVQTNKQITNTATIKLPNRHTNQFLVNKIKGGDKVVIELGYNNQLRQEFSGYVRDITFSNPVTIECEDEMYTLKRIKPTLKSFENATLADILKYLVPKATLLDIPEITFETFEVFADRSVAHALQELRENFGLEVNFVGNTLFVGVPYTQLSQANAPEVLYNMELNVIDSGLQFQRKEDVRIRVEARSITGNNEVITATVGDNDASTTTTLHFYGITVKAELERQAEEKLKQWKYDGFKGELTTFGLPYAAPGYVASIVDTRFNGARTGKYIINSVTTTFGQNGFRRAVEIGRALA